MAESAKSEASQPKFYLQPPRDGSTRSSHTEPARFKNEVRFLLPGTKKKTQPDEAVKFDSSATPQPFLNPDILDEWQRVINDSKTES